jgi:hypothetical protein
MRGQGLRRPNRLRYLRINDSELTTSRAELSPSVPREGIYRCVSPHSATTINPLLI